jgi:hypothetical protein
MKERGKLILTIVGLVVSVLIAVSGWFFYYSKTASNAEHQVIISRVERDEKDLVKIEGKAEALESRVTVVEKAIISIQDDVKYIREKIDQIR